MSLVTASGPLLEQVLDETYPVWGEGLTREAYGLWNRAQMETPWGRGHLRRLALVGPEGLRSSAKRYDFAARLGAATVPVAGIGAVFTAPDRRGRGHARELIEAMVEDAARRGCTFVLLFSEIGPAYYERLGFHALARRVVTLEVVRGRGAPAVLVRSAEPGDLAAVADLAAQRAAGSAFALERSPDLIAFGVARKRLLAGLGPPGRRTVEFFVAEEAHQPVAFVVVTRGPQGVFLEDCGDRDRSGARVGAMLQVLDARTPADPPIRLRTWLPAGFQPPQLRVVADAPAEEVMMLRGFDGVSGLPDPTQTDYTHLDVF
jgi:ribosomal protein S18 acetylase RimI-like enzyme